MIIFNKNFSFKSRLAMSGLMILVAGPYRSGTNDDPLLMRKNLDKLESVTLQLFRAGHLPVIGEWVALPLLKLAGSKVPGDAPYEEILYPVASRMLQKCDAILRLEGESKGADEDVRIGRERGLQIYFNIAEVPGCA
ncbi:hypothetical protein GCM10007423_06090 [Dyadobacter endophyticus]|uniref:Phosphoglycerate kinase n=2 Tax=Dyadobacter endophyticus TaxID=1749036 RepID=A0ABQ1YGF4_9BACT|nr:hypothetical protein GCM10007423_06090 [Dyadobacter endophyticus]